MFKSILGKSGDKQDDSSSRRKDGETRTPQRKGSESSSKSTKKPSRGDDRDGFNPSSTSYSSSTKAPYPGTAAPSIASSYATAQPNSQETEIEPPDLVRNSSLADAMPKSRSSRDDRDRGESDRKSGRSRRDRSSSRDRKSSRRDRSRSEDRSRVSGDKKEKRVKRRNTDGLYEDTKARGKATESESFKGQIVEPGYSQFPGQYDAGPQSLPRGSARADPSPMSNHVPDMFPGQFPTESTAPYRPPQSVNEGGFGLAADYYGDAGESVQHQPGVRPQKPSVIVGAEPHLMAPSAEAAPPQEPSATGGVGAADSFFNSGATFQTPSNSPRPSPHGSPGVPASQAPHGYPSISSAISPMDNSGGYRPPLGAATAAAAGAAAGYMMGGQSLSHHQSYSSEHAPQQPPRPSNYSGRLDSYSGTTKPPKPGTSPRHSPNHFAATAGAVALGTAAYEHNHQHSSHEHHEQSYNGQSPYGQVGGQSMAYQHRHKHKGPLTKFIDFFRDPDGVAEFEEYTEYIGVCRYCFEPGSTPRDAPRKHHPGRKRRSTERLDRYGSSTRIDKQDRYWTSDNESRRKNKTTGLIGAGVAGYGLAHLGKTVLGNDRDFDDTYSVRTGRYNNSSSSVHLPRRYSPDRKSKSHGVITVEEASTSRPPIQYKVDSTGHAKVRRRSRSRSRSSSRDRKSYGLGKAALGVATGAAVGAAVSASRKRDSSPKGAFVRRRRSSSSSSSSSGKGRSRRTRRQSQDTGIFSGFFASPPPKRKGSQKKKKKNVGFFNFGNGSSSSSDSVLAFGASESDRKRGKKSSGKPGKIQSTSDANKAILGIAAATAALSSASEGRSKRGNVVAVKKDVKGKSRYSGDHKQSSKRRYSHSEEDGWESASDDDASVDSALAFGLSRRRSSESLSDSSGTSKWGWRWGSKKERKRSPRRESHGKDVATMGIGLAAGAAATAALYKKEQEREKERRYIEAAGSTGSLPPMRDVHPAPVSETSSLHDARRRSEASPGQPVISSRHGSLPLQQPQPVPVVSSAVYNGKVPYDNYHAPSGPTVFAKDIPHDRHDRYDTPDHKSRNVLSEKKMRRAPSPELESKLSRRDRESSVRFDFTKEEDRIQREKDKRRRDERRSKKDSERSDRKRRDSGDDFDRQNSLSKRDSHTSRDERRADEQEEPLRRIQMFDAEEESEKDKKSSKEGSSWAAPALAGIATAAVASSLVNDRSSDSPKERRERRREERRRESDADKRRYVEIEPRDDKKSRSGKDSDFASNISTVVAAPDAQSQSSNYDQRRERRREERRAKDDDFSTRFSEEPRELTQKEHDALVEEQNRRIARRAAALVRRTPSPVHESYSTFFAPDILSKPAEGKEKASDPNADNDIKVFHVPDIITVEPNVAKAAYAGLEKFPEDENWNYDPKRLRGVPNLNLINPTPPVSRTPSRADIDKFAAIRDAQETPVEVVQSEVSEKSGERRAKSPGKVTFGKNTRHEYEVITPEEHRDEFIDAERDACKSEREIARKEEKDEARRDEKTRSTDPNIIREEVRRELEEGKTRSKDVNEKRSDAKNVDQKREDDKTRTTKVETPVEKIKRDHIPGAFDDDIDFTATVAAGLEDTGFDPNIVINDPTFRRRESPPGSHEPLNGSTVYQQPYYESVQDLGAAAATAGVAAGLASAATRGINQKHGFVDDEELPETPKDDMKSTTSRKDNDDDFKLNKKERKKKEKGEKRRSKDLDYFQDAAVKDLKDPDDAELEIIEEASREDPVEWESTSSRKGKSKKSKNDTTSSIKDVPSFNDVESFADTKSERGLNKDSYEDPAGIPLPHGTESTYSTASRSSKVDDHKEPANVPLPHGAESVYSTASRGTNVDDKDPSSVPLPHGAESVYSSASRSTKADPRDYYDDRQDDDDMYESPNEYAASAVSAPTGDAWETSSSTKKHRKKRRSHHDDDGASVVSSPAKIDDSKSKDKKKGGLMGLFRRATDETIEKREAKEAEAAREADEEAKRKKKSKRRSRDSGDLESLAGASMVDLSRMDDDTRSTTSKSSRRKSKDRDDFDDDDTRSTTSKSSRRKSKDKEGRSSSRRDSQSDGEGRRARETRKAVDEDPPDRRSRHENDTETPMSFLGERQRPTEPPDISSYGAEDDVGAMPKARRRRASSSPPISRPLTPTQLERARDDSFLENVPQSEALPRRLSMIYANPSLPAGSQMSPTAVPLLFRRPPGLGSRSVSSSPLASPSLTKPRQKRPLSTEFKSNEFRPLWLVERHNPKKEVDPEEVYPSLPSSHTTSRASSVHDDDGERPSSSSSKFQGAPLDIGATKDIHYDVLDSQQTTPTAASFKAKRDSDYLEQSRQEAIANEIEWNQKQSGEFKRKSGEFLRRDPHESSVAEDRKRDSNSFAKDLGIAAAIGGTALAAAAIMDSKDYEQAAEDKERSLEPENAAPFDGAKKEPLEATEVFEEPDSFASQEVTDDFDRPMSVKGKKKKGKKGKQTSISSQPDIGASTSDDVAAGQAPKTGGEAGVQRPTLEEQRRFEEQDTQDAMDSLFGDAPPKDYKKGKKGKKGRGSAVEEPVKVTEASSESTLPSAEPSQAEGESARRPSLSKGMDPADVAAVMASVAAADAVAKPESETTKAVENVSVPPSPSNPNVDALLNRQSSFKKSKKKGKKGRSSSVVTTDEPPSAPATVIEGSSAENTTEPARELSDAPVTEQARTLDPFDLSENTPLPFTEDGDLLEVPQEAGEIPAVHSEVKAIPTHEAQHFEQDLEQDLADSDDNMSTFVETGIHENAEPISRLESLRRRGLLPPGMPSSIPNAPQTVETKPEIVELAKESAEAPIAPSADGTEIREISTEPLPAESSSYPSQDGAVTATEVVEPALPATGEGTSKDISPATDAPAPIVEEPETQEFFDTVETSQPDFSTADQQSAEKALPADEAPLAENIAVADVPAVGDTTEPSVHPSTEIPTQEAEDEFSFAPTKKGKKGKKGKKAQLQAEDEPPTPSEPIAQDPALDTAMPTEEAAPEPAATVEPTAEDEWAVPTKKKGKKGKKSGAQTPIDEPSVPEPSEDAPRGLEETPPEAFTEPATPVAEDEWAAPSSKKKGKKGKKRQDTFESELPAIAIGVAALISEDNKEHEPVAKEPPVEPLATEDVPPVEAAAAHEPAPEDEWDNFSTKKKKKKGKKSQPVSEPETPVGELAQEEPLVDEAALSTEQVTSREIPAITEEPTAQETAAEDEWGTSFSKKKGKKKCKKSQLVSEPENPMEAPGEAPIGEESLPTSEQQPPVESAPAPEAAAPQEPAVEDEWDNFAPKKKGKKGKKKGQTTFDSEPTVDTPIGEAPLVTEEPSATNEQTTTTTEEAMPASEQPLPADEIVLPTSEQAQPALADVPAATEEEQHCEIETVPAEETVIPLETSIPLDPTSSADQVPDEPALQSETAALKDAIVPEAPVLARDPLATTEPATGEEPAAEDEWGFTPKKKKGKKGKKKAQEIFEPETPAESEGLATPAAEEPTAIEDQARKLELSTEPQTFDEPTVSEEPAADDEWALPSSKKKGKKAKKGKKGFEETFEPTEAQPAQIEDGIPPADESSTVAEEAAPSMEQPRDEKVIPIAEAVPTMEETRELKGAIHADNMTTPEPLSTEVPTSTKTPVIDESTRTEPETEEEWGFTPKKKGKKGKKKGQQASEPVTPAEPVWEPTEELAPEVTTAEPTKQTDLPETEQPVAPEPTAEEEWDFTPKKKGKKGKKKGQQMTEPEAIPETEIAPVQEAAEAEPLGADVQPSESIEPTETTVTNGPEAAEAAAEDEWGSFTTSKKGKKGKSQAELPATEELPESGAIPSEERPKNVPVLEPVSEDPRDIDVTTEQENPNEPAKEETVPEGIAASQEATDDEWASFATPKKGKKGKNGKGKAQAEPDLEPELAPTPVVMDDPRDIDIAPAEGAVTDAPLDSSLPEQPSVEASTVAQEESSIPPAEIVTEAAEDEWALPSSKSKKKGKKNKKAQVTEFEPEPELAPVEDSSVDTSDPRDVATGVSIEDQAALEPSTEILTEPSTLEAPLEAPIELEDERADSSSKKKKGKKNKKKTFEFEPEPETEVILTEAPDITAEPPSDDVTTALVEETIPIQAAVAEEPIAEDEWAAPSKKKGQKGKKKAVEFFEPKPESTTEVSEPIAVDKERAFDTTDPVDTTSHPIASAETPAEDEWAAPAKKGKKGKKNKQKSFDDFEGTPAPSTEPIETPSDDAAIAPSETALPSEEVQAKEIEPADEWAPPAKTKKGKKGKKAKGLAESWEESPEPIEQPQDVMVPEPTAEEKGLAGESIQDEPASAIVDDQAGESDVFHGFPNEPVEGAPEAEPLPFSLAKEEVEEAQPEDDWGTTSGKKKKGKKGRRVTFDPEIEESTPAILDEVPASTPIETEPSEEFSMPLPKKDRKKKKKAQAWTDVEDEPPTDITALPTETNADFPGVEETTLASNEALTHEEPGISADTLETTADVHINEAAPMAPITDPSMGSGEEAPLVPETDSKAVELPVATDPQREPSTQVQDDARELAPETQPEPEPEFAELKGKKKKKGKGKKALDDSWDFEPEASPVQPAEEDPEAAVESSQTIQADSTQDVMHEEPAPEQEPTEFAMPKSKKDKKKAKKAKAAAWDEEPVPEEPGQEAFVGENVDPVLASETLLDEPKSTPFELLDDAKDKSVEAEPEVDFGFAAPKSKKDKKKNKKAKAAAAPWDEEPSLEDPTQEATIATERGTEALAPETTTEEPLQPSAELTRDADDKPTETQAEEEFGFAAPKSKKDKKKGKKAKAAAFDWDEQPSSQPSGANTPAAEPIADISTEATPLESFDVPAEGSRELEAPQPIEEPSEFQAPVSRKDKKKGKKAKASAFSWDDEPAPQETAEAVPAGIIGEEASAAEPSSAPVEDELPTGVQRESEQPGEEPSEFQAPVSKKDKKKAKKAKSSAYSWEDEPPTEASTPREPLPEESVAQDAEQVAEIQVQPNIAEQSTALPEEESWTGGKKNKKKGKKGKSSAFAWEDEPTTLDITEAVPTEQSREAATLEDLDTPIVEPPQQAQDAEEPVAVEEETWSTGKKGKKKGKKSKAAAFSWDEASEHDSQPEATQTPDVILDEPPAKEIDPPEPLPVAAEPIDAPEEETWSAGKKSKDKKKNKRLSELDWAEESDKAANQDSQAEKPFEVVSNEPTVESAPVEAVPETLAPRVAYDESMNEPLNESTNPSAETSFPVEATTGDDFEHAAHQAQPVEAAMITKQPSEQAEVDSSRDLGLAAGAATIPVATEAVEAAADDFAPFSETRAKKGKKKKNKQSSATDTPEDTAMETFDTAIPIERTVTEVAPESTSFEPAVDMSLSRKSSKKKGKKQQVFDWEEPAESSDQAAPADSNDLPSTSTAAPIEVPQEKDDFESFGTKKSKKDKKKGKKTQETSWEEDIEAPKPIEDFVDATRDVQMSEEPLTQQPQVLHEQSGYAVDPAIATTEQQRGFEPPAEKSEEDEFAGFSSKKKGKKSKKGKRSESEDWPIEEVSSEDTKQEEEKREAPMVIDDDRVDTREESREMPIEPAIAVAEPAPAEVDEWTAFGPVKSKKGKKNKKKQEETVVWEDETATPPVEEPPSHYDTGVQEPHRAPEPVHHEIPEPSESQARGLPSSIDQQPTWGFGQLGSTSQAAEEIILPVNEPTEEAWDAPVSRKKSKKGKKKQQDDNLFGQDAPSTSKSPELLPVEKPREAPEPFDSYEATTSAERELPLKHDKPKHSSLKATGAASGAAAGIAFFEGMSRSGSKSEGKDGKKKKKKKGSQSAWNEQETPPEEQYQTDAGVNRDSALHMDSPQLPEHAHPAHANIRDSGYQGTEASLMFAGGESFDRSPIEPPHAEEHPLTVQIEHDPQYEVQVHDDLEHRKRRHSQFEMPQEGYPSPVRDPSLVDSTTKDRSAAMLFGSSPSTRDTPSHQHTRIPSIDEVTTPSREPKRTRSSSPERHGEDKPRSIFAGPIGVNSDDDGLRSPPKTPLGRGSTGTPLATITEKSPDEVPMHKRIHSIIDIGQPEHGVKAARRQGTPISSHRVHSPVGGSARGLGHVTTDDMLSNLDWPDVDDEKEIVDLERSMSRNTDKDRQGSGRHNKISPLSVDKVRDGGRRSLSGAGIRSNESISAIIKSQEPSVTPPLRRSDRSISGDLRTASRMSVGSNESSTKRDKSAKTSEFQPKRNLESEEVVASSSTYDPVNDKGKGRITKMADVYEGWGDVHGSPRSPTRPPSMRRRQSMQILDLEARLDQLVSENRLLQDAKARAERNLDDAVQTHSRQNHDYNDALQTRDQFLKQKDEELESLRETLQELQDQVHHLNEVNTGLTAATAIGGAAAVTGFARGGDSDYEQRYKELEAEYNESRAEWDENSKELDELRSKHASLSGGMEGIVRQEVTAALQTKDAELRQVRSELEAAKQQIRKLQQQILAARTSDDGLTARDEDYFDSQCAQLCQHVQQWVLRFSKFSDMKVCRSINDISDEKISDRFDNAMLDGSDVDAFLKDRVKRRDVFMSVVMMMVWEYIFTRYLFGMDREQRSKLKNLEKTLSEVATPAAVNKWRATTLSMLAKRQAFIDQRANDTEAVVEEVYATLSALLTPPSHLVQQIKDSLTKVMSSAVDLSIEMRTQKSEYIMLPVLQPEYDTNGDLVQKVTFNENLMSERGATDSQNEELANSKAVVRLVVFPPVVKRGDENGLGDEEIVVYPAQVLVADDRDRKGKKSVRVVSAQGNRSMGSIAPSQMEGGMF